MAGASSEGSLRRESHSLASPAHPMASHVGVAPVPSGTSPVQLVPCVATPSGWGWPLFFGRAGARGLAAEATSVWPALSGGPESSSSSSSATPPRGFTTDDASGCVYRTVVSKECFLDTKTDGGPIRRCEMLRRTFRQCAGRPMEELESVVESFTEDQLSPSLSLSADSSPGWPFSAGKYRSLQDGPLPGDLPPAKLFEDFFQLARDVQQGMEKEAGNQASQSLKSPALSGAWPGGLSSLADDKPPNQEPSGLLGWLFGSSSSSGGSSSLEQKSWARQRQQQQQATCYKDYERGFQDV